MKFRVLAVCALVGIGVVVGVSAHSNEAKIEDEYNNYLKVARTYAEKGIPYTSYQNYMSAMAINNTDEKVYKEFLEQCKLLGEDKYVNALQEYIGFFPTSAEAYEILCGIYYDRSDYKGTLELTLKASENGVDTEKIKNYYLDCFYRYRYIKTGLEEATSYLGDIAIIKQQDKYGYIDGTGSFILAPMYKSAAFFLEGYTSVCTEKDGWFIIDRSGNMIEKPADKDIQYLSFESGGKLLIKKNNKYGYTDKSLTIPEKLEYDDATNFKNGVAAVKKDKKWALISPDGNSITDFVFEDVIIDEYNTCISNNIIFVKNKGKYYMVDKTGNKVCETAFDGAYPFVDDTYAAVCKDGKWGFVDSTGNFVIEPKYDGAKSFGNGLAPVMEKGIWGYVNTKGEYRLDDGFEDALPFTSNGIALIKENGVWNYIKLLSYC